MMTYKTLLLVLASSGCAALAQLFFKLGMSTPQVQSAMERTHQVAELARAVMFNPNVLLGLGLYGLGTVLWLFVLARLDVSMAYPFVGLAIVLTMLMGFFVLGEAMTLARVFGTLLVVIGISMISST